MTMKNVEALEKGMSDLLDLALVMPVYNEDGCIVEVIRSWYTALCRLDIRFVIIALNDGSTDRTEALLAGFEGDHSVYVVNKKNSGHGSTILQGYELAVQRAEWVFQCDSDDEMKPEFFSYLWAKRDNFEALFGTRKNRSQNLGRKVISSTSRFTVGLLFGSGVTDVNTPYRLIRADILQQIITQIPADTFAPNVIISGALGKAKVRIFEYPVPHENRRTGSVSIVKWKLWQSAFKSLKQTLTCRPVIAEYGKMLADTVRADQSEKDSAL